MSKNQDRQAGVNRGELQEKVITPAKGMGRALRRTLERQERHDKRKQRIEALRKQ